MSLEIAWNPVSMASLRALEWTFIMDTDDTSPLIITQLFGMPRQQDMQF